MTHPDTLFHLMRPSTHDLPPCDDRDGKELAAVVGGKVFIYDAIALMSGVAVAPSAELEVSTEAVITSLVYNPEVDSAKPQ